VSDLVFENMLCLIGRLHAVALADDGATRNSGHACDISHTLLRSTRSGFRFSSRDVSTRPSTGRHDPLHPRSVAAVEPFPCQALEGRERAGLGPIAMLRGDDALSA
jgi:hypothetical protein